MYKQTPYNLRHSSILRAANAMTTQALSISYEYDLSEDRAEALLQKVYDTEQEQYAMALGD